MTQDLEIEFERLPRWSGVGSYSTVVPGTLVILEFLQDEVVKLDYIGVLHNTVSLRCH